MRREQWAVRLRRQGVALGASVAALCVWLRAGVVIVADGGDGDGRAIRPPSGARAATASGMPAHPEGDSLMIWVDGVIARDPFRLLASSAASDGPDEVGATSERPAAPALPKPVIRVIGIIGMRDGWQAVLAGVPSHERGVLVVAGDTVGGLVVRRISPDSIIVQGADTVWRLAMERR